MDNERKLRSYTRRIKKLLKIINKMKSSHEKEIKSWQETSSQKNTIIENLIDENEKFRIQVKSLKHKIKDLEIINENSKSYKLSIRDHYKYLIKVENFFRKLVGMKLI